jgi:uroporphyrinogen decarboxylase
MTPRERAIKALRREKPDKVPKDFGMTPQIYELIQAQTGASDPWAHFACEPRWIGWRATRFRRDFSAYLGDSPCGSWLDKKLLQPENTEAENVLPVGGEWGTGPPPSVPWVDQEWGVGYIPTASEDPQHAHLSGLVYPMRTLKTVEELREYPFSDYEAAYRHKHLEQELEGIHQKELFSSGGLAMTLFEVAWQLRGMDLLFYDFAENKPFAETLLDTITEMRRFMIRRFAEAGVDHIHLGDDVGTQQGMLMSPRMWREWFKERMRSIISVAKKINPEVIISYHSDGNIEKIIPELIEIGIEVLNPVQPEAMDPAELKREYGDRLAFWGTVGTQTTMPFGTPEEVKSVVRECIETVGDGGGLLIAPTHILEPEVPWENIRAFFEAVEEFGRY